jgi:hypothetical protein
MSGSASFQRVRKSISDYFLFADNTLRILTIRSLRAGKKSGRPLIQARADDFLTTLLRKCAPGRLTQSPLFVTTCSAGLTFFLRISSSRNKSVSSARR